MAVVGVSDEGPGIAPEDQQRIFGEFQKIRVPKRRGGEEHGLGAGHRQTYCGGHRGALTVQSEVGAGSTFSFAIQWRKIMVDGKKPRVLIAEDESHSRLSVEQPCLTSMNCEVVGEATTGVEAIEFYKQLKASLAPAGHQLGPARPETKF